MVSGRDEHRHRQPGEGRADLLRRFIIRIFRIKKVAGEKNDVRLSLHGDLAKPAEERPLLLAAGDRLVPAQPLKGGIQMKIRSVQNTNHVILKASTFTQQPVSVSISKMQHSILQAPPADL